MIELRFFRERYKMDRDYYSGNRDVYCRLYFRTIDELESKWNRIMSADNHELEGETYSAWYKRGKICWILCGGAFDPGDIDYIVDEYRKYEEELK